eukprot:scaffold26714_cov160-Skeletonema_menzelii.AAC.3
MMRWRRDFADCFVVTHAHPPKNSSSSAKLSAQSMIQRSSQRWKWKGKTMSMLLKRHGDRTSTST